MELQLEAAKHSAILAVDQSTVERSPFMYTDTHDNHFGGIVGSQDYKLGQSDELKKALLGQPSATIHLPQWGKLQALIVDVVYRLTQDEPTETGPEMTTGGDIGDASRNVLEYLPFKLIQQINFKTETGNIITTVYLQDRIMEYIARGGRVDALCKGRILSGGTRGATGVTAGVARIQYKFAIPFEFFKCASTWPDLRTLTRMDLEFIPNVAASVSPFILMEADIADNVKSLAEDLISQTLTVEKAQMTARYVRANELVEQEVLSAKHPSMRAFMRVAYSDAREQRTPVTVGDDNVVSEVRVPIKCQQPVVLTRIQIFSKPASETTMALRPENLSISNVRIEDSGQVLYESNFDNDALTALQPFSTSVLRDKTFSGVQVDNPTQDALVINHGLIGCLDLIDKDMYSAKSFYQMSDPVLVIQFEGLYALEANETLFVQVSHLAQQAVTIQASENMRNREIYKVGDK